MADEKDQAAAQAEHEEAVAQDVSGYIGVDPVYQNYSDDRNKPFAAESDGDNDREVELEEAAYAHQAATRESAGQDPETGKAVDVDPDEQYNSVRDQYKDPNWRPNVTPRMTGIEAPLPEKKGAETGSTETVQSDGTTGDKAPSGETGDAPSDTTPSAPQAPTAKKTAPAAKK